MEFAAEYVAEHLDRKKKVVTWFGPAGVIGRQSLLPGSGSREHARLFSDRGSRLRSSPLETLGIEEPKSCKIYRNGAWRQLALLEQFCLVFANLLGAQAVWRTMEALREIFHYPDVTVYGSFA